MLMTSGLMSTCSRIKIRLHVFLFLVKVSPKVRKISSSVQYLEVEISFQVTISSFFIWWCHQMMTIDSIFFISANANDDNKTKASFRDFYLRLQSLLTFALEFVSLMNIIYFCLFSVIRSSSVNREAKENPLFLWRWLFSDISNAATAEFSSCFYILDETSKIGFLVF